MSDQTPITLTGAIEAVKNECARRDVPDFNGESIMFLDALLALADGDADNAADAVALAYGLEA